VCATPRYERTTPTCAATEHCACSYCEALALTPEGSGATAQQQQESSQQQQQQQQQKSSKPPAATSASTFRLVSSHGSADPELPPVLGFTCKKFNYTQQLNHFPAPTQHEVLSESSSGSRASRRRLQQQQGSSSGGAGTFTQVYWVCDASWPTDAAEQVRQ
jgi:hypothetical protein